MSSKSNKLIDYLLKVQCMNRTLVKWIQETGYDNLAAFVQTFALPNLDLVGVSYDLYLPDKSMLGKRTDGILAFEKAIAAIANPTDYNDYCVTSMDRDAFQLRAGHVIGLQLVGTEIRNRGNDFIEKLPSSQDETTSEPAAAFSPESIREIILEKLQQRLEKANLDRDGLDIIFRQDRAYMKCPCCRHLFKVVQRKSKKGMRYEVFDSYRHIQTCYQSMNGPAPGKRARKQNMESLDDFDENSSMEYVSVKVEDILGKNGGEEDVFNDDSQD